MKKTLFPIRNFLGLNRLDGADKVQDNQFFALTNWYQATRGLFYKRNGSTSDLSAISGAASITGLHRHYGQYKDPFTIYHCEPSNAVLPQPTGLSLGLAEISGGDLYNGGSVTAIGFTFTYVGMGGESLDSKLVTTGSAAQTFTPSANTKGIRVTAPAFPAGVRSINVFANRPGMTMTYVGSINTSGGTLDYLSFIGPNAAINDPVASVGAVASTSGTLKPGTYYVALAWVSNPGGTYNPVSAFSSGTLGASLCPAKVLTVGPAQGSIVVSPALSASTNGSTFLYVFVGTQDPATHPMTCVGIVGRSGTLTINSIPKSLNAQSFNQRYHFSSGSDADTSMFWNGLGWEQGAQLEYQGFLIRKSADGSTSEVLPSRSFSALIGNLSSASLSGFGYDPVTGSTLIVPTGSIRSAAWLAWQQGLGNLTGLKIYSPSFAYLSGLTYFANGVDLIWQTDGYTLAPSVPKVSSYLPPVPRFISVYQSSLQASGGNSNNQVYACNALNTRDWGNVSTGYNFVSIGDLFGDSTTALSVFSRSTDAINDPGAFFLSFKKHGCWMMNGFPYTPGGAGAMLTLSARVGTVAPCSIVSTPLGVIFLGTDGYTYIIRGGGEPQRIGGSVKPVFAHLVGNDTLMSKVTAVYHDDHYKLSFPSASTSTGNDAQLWADLRTMDNSPITWTGPHTGINIGPQIVLAGEGDDLSRIGAMTGQNFSAKLDDTSTYQDLGVTVVSSLQSKTFRFRSETHLKRILAMFMDAYFDSAFTHQVLMEMFADSTYFQSNQTLSSGGATYDSSMFDQSLWSDAEYQGLPFFVDNTNLLGRTFYAKFTHSSPAPFIIAEMGILLKPERRSIV